MNNFWKFEASMTEDKNFEILAILGPPYPYDGALNQNFGPTVF